MNEAANPPVVARNLRRDMPSCLAARSESAASRASTSFCLSVWPIGMYSPFDTIWVGRRERAGEPRLDLLLVVGLTDRHVLAVRHHRGRDRGVHGVGMVGGPQPV